MNLYIYEHCPFCTKARMIFGLKDIPVTTHIIMEGDAETPTKMIGKKMVPILQKEDGSYMGESMDIVHYVDQLKGATVFIGKSNEAVTAWIKHAWSYALNLIIPRFTKGPFAELATEHARASYLAREQKAFGDLDEKLANSAQWISQINADLAKLDAIIQSPEAVNGQLSEDDIHLFSTLRSLSIVKGIQWPAKVKTYMESLSAKTNIPLLFDMAM